MANIKDKRTFYPSDESADYLNQFKRGTLSDNLNNIIELLHENDADYLQLTKIIDFYNEFKPLVDMQVRGSFESKVMNQHPMPMNYVQPQTVSIENNPMEEVTNEDVVESDSSKDDTHAIRTKQMSQVDNVEAEASKLDLSVDEYREIQKKAKKYKKTVEQYIRLEENAEMQKMTIEEYIDYKNSMDEYDM